MDLKGKGFFLWNISQCEGGDPERIASIITSMGLSHLIVKVADGTQLYNMDKKTNQSPVSSIINTIKARNIAVWGCQSVYGLNPEAEVKLAIKCIKELSLEGFVVDAGEAFEQKGSSRKASIFMTRLKQALPGVPIALSSFRFPSMHPSFPWRPFLEKSDLIMPKVFWLDTHGNVGKDLYRTIHEYQNILPDIPICPTGPLFKVWGWMPHYDEILEFLSTAEALGLKAINFFSLESACQPVMKNLKQLVFESKWPNLEAEKGIAERYVEALNLRKIDNLLVLYQDNASLTLRTGTIKGKRRLKKWHKDLFENRVTMDMFKLINSSEQEGIFTFTWTAEDGTSHLPLFAKNVVRLEAEKIISHTVEFIEVPPQIDRPNQ